MRVILQQKDLGTKVDLRASFVYVTVLSSALLHSSFGTRYFLETALRLLQWFPRPLQKVHCFLWMTLISVAQMGSSCLPLDVPAHSGDDTAVFSSIEQTCGRHSSCNISTNKATYVKVFFFLFFLEQHPEWILDTIIIWLPPYSSSFVHFLSTITSSKQNYPIVSIL